MTDSTPSSVTAGGGVFIAHVVDQMCWSISIVALVGAALRPRLKSGESPGNEEPCWLSGRQGSRNFDDLCKILNYLLASLVRSSFAELGRVLVAWTPNPNPGLPMRTDIPAQRNHEVACECFGYVLSEVIGNEGDARYALVLRTVNQKVGKTS